MGLAASTDRRPVFYFIGDSITEFGGDPTSCGFVTLLMHQFVRSVDMVNRGLAGYNTRWVLQRGMPIFAKELAEQYAGASFVTIFLGANDATLVNGPDARQHVPLDEYAENLKKMVQLVTPLLEPKGKLLLITPPCVIDSTRAGDRTNAYTGEYARACVQVAQAENVHVLDLHTYFNTTYPQEADRKAFFVDGLHFSAKGNEELTKLLNITITGIFDKSELDRFNKPQIP
uniref:SGNH hydrolase-type esterase domain-containing protein n=1 Tax=Globisporangium ultimum (strain ATCC 200006 / CBS 805.95 / DAOM BR144) TaxID=431595 RepID=K3WMD5_GLOUD